MCFEDFRRKWGFSHLLLTKLGLVSARFRGGEGRESGLWPGFLWGLLRWGAHSKSNTSILLACFEEFVFQLRMQGGQEHLHMHPPSFVTQPEQPLPLCLPRALLPTECILPLISLWFECDDGIIFISLFCICFHIHHLHWSWVPSFLIYLHASSNWRSSWASVGIWVNDECVPMLLARISCWI